MSMNVDQGRLALLHEVYLPIFLEKLAWAGIPCHTDEDVVTALDIAGKLDYLEHVKSAQAASTGNIFLKSAAAELDVILGGPNAAYEQAAQQQRQNLWHWALNAASANPLLKEAAITLQDEAALQTLTQSANAQ